MTGQPEHYTLDDGSERWELDNRLHRADGPALVFPDGTETWYWHGEIHRDGGPAITKGHGTQEWWRHGKRHREDGPAVISPAQGEKWYIDGLPLAPEEVAAIRERQEAAARAKEAQGIGEELDGGLKRSVKPLRPPRFRMQGL